MDEKAGLTLGRRLDDCNGIGPGFDQLRISLSLVIFFWHCFYVAYGTDWARNVATPIHPLTTLLLPLFFALSGFLVMGSALRLGRLRSFILFRILRIVPALAVEILLSALLLGPLLTEVSLGDYFSSPMFVDYFGSLIGRVRFELPGMFLDTPVPRLVNGALWTIGAEILCYVILALAMLGGVYRNRRAMLVLVIGYGVACLIFDWFDPRQLNGVVASRALVLSFLTGNVLYLHRHRVPLSWTYAALSLALACAAISSARMWPVYYGLVYPAAALLAYVAAAIGLTRLPPIAWAKRGDYSYGIYIYGSPIQQAIVHLLPGHRDWYVVLAIGLPITIACAMLSWHWIEKPFLDLRRPLLGLMPADQTGRPKKLRFRIAAAVGLSVYAVIVANWAYVWPIRDMVKAAIGM